MPIKTKIVGVTFGDCQNVMAVLDKGETLYLRDMASAQFPEAIGVFTSYGEQCGSINKKLAVSIREQYGDFESLDVTVLQVTGGEDGMSYGCNIEIDGYGEIERDLPNYGAYAPTAKKTAIKKKAIKPKTVVAAAILVLAVLCAAVAVYAISTNQGGGALRAGAVSVVLFLAAALLITRKGRKQ